MAQSNGSTSRLPVSVAEPRELFKGFIRVWERRTRRADDPTAKEIDWHVAGVAGEAPHAVHVFTFNTKTGTTTLIHEYAQGPNRMLLSLPAGRTGKKSVLEAAMAELSEEVQLKAPKDRWHLLGDEEGFVEGKWITSISRGVLVLDPIEDSTPGQQDIEEDIEVIRDVPLSRIQELMVAGKLLPASVQTALMAVDLLQRSGYEAVVRQSGWR